MGKFTLLHTSDWHLGHKLYSRNREEEFRKLTAWLADLIRERGVDAVLITGDIFHTPLPDTEAQKIYYDFLRKAREAGAKHIIVTAGNHDSPAFLTAPRDILSSLNVHVSGAAGNDVEDEIAVLHDESGEAQAVICAVPFLREKDARATLPGEDNSDKERAYKEGITAHYRKLADAVREKYASAGIPLIASGHLFSVDSTVSKGMERLYAGGEGAVEASIFDEIFDYVALGHIHRPRQIGDLATRRYAGSPIPIHFDEIEYSKSVVLAHFDGRHTEVELCPAPVFQRLVSLRGSRMDLLATMREIYEKAENPEEGVWFELNHDGSDSFAGLDEQASALLPKPWAVLRCNPAPYKGGAGFKNMERNLEDFTVEDIFDLCLKQNKKEGAERQALLGAFRELLALYNEMKRNGEL